jgi:hypothetical protein
LTNEEFKKIKSFLKTDNPKVLGEKFFKDPHNPIAAPQKKIFLSDSGFEFLAIFDSRSGELLNFLETKRPGEVRAT